MLERKELLKKFKSSKLHIDEEIKKKKKGRNAVQKLEKKGELKDL